MKKGEVKIQAQSTLQMNRYGLSQKITDNKMLTTAKVRAEIELHFDMNNFFHSR